MRNPSLQAKNRMIELQKYQLFLVEEVRNKRYEHIEAQKVCEKIVQQHSELQNLLKRVNELIELLANGGDGLFPWGLPKTISISRFKETVLEADIPNTDLELEMCVKD